MDMDMNFISKYAGISTMVFFPIILFIVLVILSAIFMGCWNKTMLYFSGQPEQDFKKIDFWTSMTTVILLSIIGSLVFKSSPY